MLKNQTEWIKFLWLKVLEGEWGGRHVIVDSVVSGSLWSGNIWEENWMQGKQAGWRCDRKAFRRREQQMQRLQDRMCWACLWNKISMAGSWWVWRRWQERRLIDHAKAFMFYCTCDEKPDVTYAHFKSLVLASVMEWTAQGWGWIHRYRREGGFVCQDEEGEGGLDKVGNERNGQIWVMFEAWSFR